MILQCLLPGSITIWRYSINLAIYHSNTRGHSILRILRQISASLYAGGKFCKFWFDLMEDVRCLCALIRGSVGLWNSVWIVQLTRLWIYCTTYLAYHFYSLHWTLLIGVSKEQTKNKKNKINEVVYISFHYWSLSSQFISARGHKEIIRQQKWIPS